MDGRERLEVENKSSVPNLLSKSGDVMCKVDVEEMASLVHTNVIVR